jgi:hypothetical protein
MDMVMCACIQLRILQPCGCLHLAAAKQPSCIAAHTLQQDAPHGKGFEIAAGESDHLSGVKQPHYCCNLSKRVLCAAGKKGYETTQFNSSSSILVPVQSSANGAEAVPK